MRGKKERKTEEVENRRESGVEWKLKTGRERGKGDEGRRGKVWNV